MSVESLQIVSAAEVKAYDAMSTTEVFDLLSTHIDRIVDMTDPADLVQSPKGVAAGIATYVEHSDGQRLVRSGRVGRSAHEDNKGYQLRLPLFFSEGQKSERSAPSMNFGLSWVQGGRVKTSFRRQEFQMFRAGNPEEMRAIGCIALPRLINAVPYNPETQKIITPLLGSRDEVVSKNSSLLSRLAIHLGM